MEIIFEKEYLSELYYKGKCSNKKYRFQPQVVKNYKKCIDLLESVSGIESLYRYHSLNYEVLQGKKDGISSVRVNDRYRIEFTISKAEAETQITICSIIELSNHYK